ncbi:hypothetical protein [Roseospirillum parvum]|uniref:Uncharacterized protein n=1 Tax=Roseospirillum parvum TaxID=83401 RepID=A0A1G7UDI0_9PROT|nr:hypothetical protein [Roseospirillum parvum]SDG45646.1 hypothetical protein SAMN05421742_101298 [Roseospirillum parvum]
MPALVLTIAASVLSLGWLAGLGLLIGARPGWSALADLPASELAVYAGLAVGPPALLWLVVVAALQMIALGRNSRALRGVLWQSKRLVDLSESQIRALLQVQTQVQRGAVMANAELALKDMIGQVALCAEHLRLIDTEQAEHLWARTSLGDIWAFHNVFLEHRASEPGFPDWLVRRAQSHEPVRVAMATFLRRHDRLVRELEEVEADRLFREMLENGAQGRLRAFLSEVDQRVRAATGQPVAPDAPRQPRHAEPSPAEPLPAERLETVAKPPPDGPGEAEDIRSMARKLSPGGPTAPPVDEPTTQLPQDHLPQDQLPLEPPPDRPTAPTRAAVDDDEGTVDPSIAELIGILEATQAAEDAPEAPQSAESPARRADAPTPRIRLKARKSAGAAGEPEPAAKAPSAPAEQAPSAPAEQAPPAPAEQTPSAPAAPESPTPGPRAVAGKLGRPGKPGHRKSAADTDSQATTEEDQARLRARIARFAPKNPPDRS